MQRWKHGAGINGMFGLTQVLKRGNLIEKGVTEAKLAAEAAEPI